MVLIPLYGKIVITHHAFLQPEPRKKVAGFSLRTRQTIHMIDEVQTETDHRDAYCLQRYEYRAMVIIYCTVIV